MAITARHMFGWEREKELKGKLQDHLGEYLEKTTWRYDSIDFVSPSWVVELKSRLPLDKNRKPQRPEGFETWLLPATKVEAAGASPLKGRFYYYWSWDSSLWYLDYEGVNWQEVYLSVPPWHTEPHYWVPRELWKPVLPAEEA